MIKISKLSKTFNKGNENEICVFNDFDLEFESGKCVAIIGPNGCGKSTLMNMIAGSIPADSGKVYIDNKDITPYKEEKRAKYIGRVYQDPSMGVSPSLSILENMSLADKKGQKFTLRSLIKNDRIDKYKEILKPLDLGLENKMNTKVQFLSGGQRQSLSLIMASMKNPAVLLLDEHTAALDPKTSAMVMEKTKELIERHKITTIMISHNMRDAIKNSDRIIMLDSGKVILDKKSSDVTEDELINIYRKNIDQLF